jgi:hypothetical protein
MADTDAKSLLSLITADDDTEPPQPPQLTDNPQAIRRYIHQWFKSRGVPVDERLQECIKQVSWTGEDLLRPLRALIGDLKDWRISEPHAIGIARDMRQEITRKEVCQFRDPRCYHVLSADAIQEQASLSYETVTIWYAWPFIWGFVIFALIILNLISLIRGQICLGDIAQCTRFNETLTVANGT